MQNRVTTHLAVAALVAGAFVPVTAAASIADIAVLGHGCLDESYRDVVLGLPTRDGCDDDTPPETTAKASPTPNAAGFVSTASMTFTVVLDVTDTDAGPFGLQCRLTAAVPVPEAHDWRDCSSPVTYAGLPDAPAGAYTFSARAVDLGDHTRNPDHPSLGGTVTDTPDLDQTPAKVTWGQDTRMPFVFVTPEAYDEITPTQPVVTSTTVPIRLNSSDRGSRFECTDNGAAIACSAGTWELREARAGRHVFSARTIDPAGNTSAWSDPIEFFVPRDVRRARGWTRRQNAAYVGGEALLGRQRGLRLVLPRTRVGELRLLAPTAPSYGKVRIRVGRRDWHTVNLAGRRSDLRQLVVLDRYSGERKGRITIETLSNKPVLIDAIVARRSTFPPAV